MKCILFRLWRLKVLTNPPPEVGETRMRLKTILNRVEPYKDFIYESVRWGPGRHPAIEIRLRPKARALPNCSGCRRPGPAYDHCSLRRFQFVPLWGIVVVFIYAMRRVECDRCGVTVECVPWARGKSRLTTTFQWFLATWAKKLSWHEVAMTFGTSWASVYRSVRMAVQWGLKHRVLAGLIAIGVDEIMWLRGHQYLTVVYQIQAKCKRLIWVGKDRTEESFLGFFAMLGETLSARLRYVCSDMWQPYVKLIAEKAKNAINILDRFHIMSRMNKAIDEIRASEAKQLVRDGYEPVLKHSRWCLLKRPENLTLRQTVKLSELLRYNLRAVRAYLLREEFQRFWEYQSSFWAGRFFDEWSTRVMRSRLGPLKRLVVSLREKRKLLMNWFLAQGTISSGIVEGMNNKAKLVMRRAYGFRTYRAVEVALYHNLGDLPEPHFTHRFW
jgi:transposase